jgi:hypothetical protein
VGAEVIKMKTKAFSIAILLLVVLAFSGVASAATQQVLVSDAYDEEVLVSPAYDEEVLVSEAWNEEVLVKDAYRMWHCDIYIWEDAVYEHHEAVYDWVLIEEGYYKDVLVSGAWNETVDPVFEEQVVREVPQGYFNNFCDNAYKKAYDKADKFAQQQVNVHGYSGYSIEYVKEWGNKGHFVVFFLDEVMVQEGYVIEHPAVYDTVYVDPVYEYQMIQEAYDELVKEEGGYVLVQHAEIETAPNYNDGYQDMINQCTQLVPNWSMIAHPHTDFPAEFKVIEHPAVYETVHHDAVYETVHHPAVYKDVEVADPVVDEPVKEEAKTIPMEETGVPLLPLGIAALLVFLGLALVGFRRRDE